MSDNISDKNNGKLTAEERTAVALSNGKALREVATEFDLHHSTVDEIRKEAQKVLFEYFKEKSTKIGRPAKKPEKSQGIIELEKKIEDLNLQMKLKNFQEDFLRLELKQANEVLEEAKLKREKNKKKRKRKKS
jgi:hypothetical protein